MACCPWCDSFLCHDENEDYAPDLSEIEYQDGKEICPECSKPIKIEISEETVTTYSVDISKGEPLLTYADKMYKAWLEEGRPQI